MKKNILVVDDDVDILDALQFVLEASGYLVTTSQTGELAEELGDKKNRLPQLIILDVLLSGKDGRIICKKLKQTKVTKNIPIIMMSAHPRLGNSLLKIGANDFIAKPFGMQDIISRVKKYI